MSINIKELREMHYCASRLKELLKMCGVEVNQLDHIIEKTKLHLVDKGINPFTEE